MPKYDDGKERCPECGGDKKVECDCTGGLGKNAVDDDCPACGGRGVITCPRCQVAVGFI